MNELDRFFELFLESLSLVDDSYYRTTYKNISNLFDVLRNRGRIVGENLERFGERTFCYELYHHLRIKIDEEVEQNESFLNGAMLQGEVKKVRVIEFVKHFGLERLKAEYIPDFLIHTPGEVEYHPYIIEVKCSPYVSEKEILNDIAKINEFITRYQYERGIFLTTNTSPEYINQSLVALQEQIQKLEGRSRIKIVCKSSQKSEPNITQL